MSKYYKADCIFQVIDKIFQNAPEEVIEAIKSVDLVIEINKLPTIEVNEDCISREYLEEQLQQIEDITAMAHIDLGENPYDETEEITMPISTVRKIFKNAPSVVPSRAEGEWIMHVDDLFPCESTQECSVCHSQHLICGNDDNYCPYCGAYMKGAE